VTKIVALIAMLSLVGLGLLERTGQRTSSGRGLHMALDVPRLGVPEGHSFRLHFSLDLPFTPLEVHHVTELSSPRAARGNLRLSSSSVIRAERRRKQRSVHDTVSFPSSSDPCVPGLSANNVGSWLNTGRAPGHQATGSSTAAQSRRPG
jgi:hypothetical protein